MAVWHRCVVTMNQTAAEGSWIGHGCLGHACLHRRWRHCHGHRRKVKPHLLAYARSRSTWRVIGTRRSPVDSLRPVATSADDSRLSHQSHQHPSRSST